MRINHNIMAMNTHMEYKVSGLSKSKSGEKLSSGLRINRSGDDVSGLAMSEKMRAQIRGLERASQNISDGISLIQTAEGGMQEIHNMLSRMRELIVQAANDSYDSPVDRPAIQKEMDQLNAEINDIANQTEFNGVKLLNGGIPVELPPPEMPIEITEAADVVFVVDNSGSMSNSIDFVKNTVTEFMENMPAGSRVRVLLYSDINVTGEGDLLRSEFSSDSSEIIDFLNTSPRMGGGDELESGLEGINEAIGLFSASGSVEKHIIFITDAPSHSMADGDGLDDDGLSLLSVSGTNKRLTENDITFHGIGPSSGLGRDQIEALENGTNGSIHDINETINRPQPPSITDLVVQSGANFGNIVPLRIYDCRPETLGIDGILVDPRDMAMQALDKISSAIDIVSGYRADAGSRQKRLEITQQNVDNAALNLTAAESLVRDVDMAEEMSAYYTYSVLKDASTAMLQQANNMPQSVLNLIG